VLLGAAGCLSPSCEQPPVNNNVHHHFTPITPPVCLPLPRGSQKCCKRRFGWLLEHLEPQTACQFDDRGAPAVDFFGRVENLDEDMQVRYRRYRGHPQYSAGECSY
jgi:hypothetical protein